MSDDKRVYTDEEFAVILRTAAQMATRTEQRADPSSGLTLAEMKSAAAQAGLDPALIERAARLTVTQAHASPLERIVGGPFRHEHEAHFATRLDEESAARLLSAIRINAAHIPSANDGHSSALGMTWQASGGGDVFSVVARPDQNGTSVSVVIDRRGTFVIAAMMSSLVIFMSLLAGVGMYNEIGAIAPWIPVAGAAGTLTVLRRFWSSSSRKARERIGSIIDAVSRTLDSQK